jgi:hypothetical protein
VLKEKEGTGSHGSASFAFIAFTVCRNREGYLLIWKLLFPFFDDLDRIQQEIHKEEGERE